MTKTSEDLLQRLKEAEDALKKKDVALKEKDDEIKMKDAALEEVEERLKTLKRELDERYVAMIRQEYELFMKERYIIANQSKCSCRFDAF